MKPNYARCSKISNISNISTNNTNIPGQANQYFVHILSIGTDEQPFLNQRKEENDLRKYLMINGQECMGPGQDQTQDPWIGIQICY